MIANGCEASDSEDEEDENSPEFQAMLAKNVLARSNGGIATTSEIASKKNKSIADIESGSDKKDVGSGRRVKFADATSDEDGNRLAIAALEGHGEGRLDGTLRSITEGESEVLAPSPDEILKREVMVRVKRNAQKRYKRKMTAKVPSMETSVFKARKLLASRTLTGDKLADALVLVRIMLHSSSLNCP